MNSEQDSCWYSSDSNSDSKDGDEKDEFTSEKVSVISESNAGSDALIFSITNQVLESSGLECFVTLKTEQTVKGEIGKTHYVNLDYVTTLQPVESKETKEIILISDMLQSTGYSTNRLKTMMADIYQATDSMQDEFIFDTYFNVITYAHYACRSIDQACSLIAIQSVRREFETLIHKMKEFDAVSKQIAKNHMEKRITENSRPFFKKALNNNDFGLNCGLTNSAMYFLLMAECWSVKKLIELVQLALNSQFKAENLLYRGTYHLKTKGFDLYFSGLPLCSAWNHIALAEHCIIFMQSHSKEEIEAEGIFFNKMTNYCFTQAGKLLN